MPPAFCGAHFQGPNGGARIATLERRKWTDARWPVVLRQLPKGQGALLVAPTGWSQEADRRRFREAGFDERLVKPVEFDAVQAAVTESRFPQ